MKSAMILAQVGEYVELSDAEKDFLDSVLIARPFKAGELLIAAGDTARYMLFVNSGYLMTYYSDMDGNDHVMQFARDGWWCGDIHSMSTEPKTIYSTKCLGDGEVLLLPRPAHQQLLERYPRFEKYFRMIFQLAVMRLQLRMVEGHSATAEERYLTFINKFPGMQQYVAQKHIASYLGITPEFLSKIRKKLAGK